MKIKLNLNQLRALSALLSVFLAENANRMQDTLLAFLLHESLMAIWKRTANLTAKLLTSDGQKETTLKLSPAELEAMGWLLSRTGFDIELSKLGMEVTKTQKIRSYALGS